MRNILLVSCAFFTSNYLSANEFPNEFYNIPSTMECDTQSPFYDKKLPITNGQQQNPNLNEAVLFNAWRVFLGINSDAHNPKTLNTSNAYTPRWGTWEKFTEKRVFNRLFQATFPFCDIDQSSIPPYFSEAATLPSNGCNTISYPADFTFKMPKDEYCTGHQCFSDKLTSFIETHWADMQKPKQQKSLAWKCESECLEEELNLKGVFKASNLGGGLVVDRNNKEVFYEVRFNPMMSQSYLRQYNYFVQNPNSPVGYFFPQGSCNTAKEVQQFPSFAIKTAWKVLGSKDQADEFFVIKNVNVPNKTERVDLAMISMHISTKEVNFTSWRWSTFEHKSLIKKSSKQAALFYTKSDAPKNMLEDAYGIKSDAIYPYNFSDVLPPRLTRENPIKVATKNINTQFSQELKDRGSVLSNYQLVGVQYYNYNSSGQPVKPLIEPNLRNLVLEAYIKQALISKECTGQDTVTKTIGDNEVNYQCNRPFKGNSGCLTCHQTAQEQQTDFIFGINELKNDIKGK